jgi:hypothetical protein
MINQQESRDAANYHAGVVDAFAMSVALSGAVACWQQWCEEWAMRQKDSATLRALEKSMSSFPLPA